MCTALFFYLSCLEKYEFSTLKYILIGAFCFPPVEILLKGVQGKWRKRFCTVAEGIEVYDGPYFLGETVSWFWTTCLLNVLSYTGELYFYGRRFYCSGGESLWLRSSSWNCRSSISYAGLMPWSTLSIKNIVWDWVIWSIPSHFSCVEKERKNFY